MPRSERRLLLAATASIALLTTAASAIPVGELAAALQQEWRWSRFDVEAGLPDNNVFDIVETAAGTIWISTPSGLAWFDNYQWHLVPTQFSPRGNSRLLPIGADSLGVVVDGDAFVGDRTGFSPLSNDSDAVPILAVARLAGRRIVLRQDGAYDAGAGGVLHRLPWAPSVGLSQDGRPAMAVGDRALWLNTTDGLARLDGHGWSLVLRSAAVQSLAALGDGGVVAAIASPIGQAGLWELPGRGPARQIAQWVGRTGSLDVSKAGQGLTVCEAGHVHIRDEGRWLPDHEREARVSRARTLRFDGRGDLWLADDGGLWLIRLSDRLWSTEELSAQHAEHAEPAEHRSGRINKLHRSADGSLWIGSDAGVTARNSDGTSQTVTRAAGIELDNVTGIAHDVTGRLWVTSGGAFGGALVQDAGEWHHVGAAAGLTDAGIHRVRADKQGRLWFLSLGQGAFMLDAEGFHHLPMPDVVGAERVYDLADDSDGTLWFATSGGLLRWHDGAWRHWSRDHGLVATRVTTVAYCRGRIWFGHSNSHAGLGSIVGDGPPRYDINGAHVIDSGVREVRADPAGKVWLTSNDGIWHETGEGFAHIGPQDGLPETDVWPLLAEAGRTVVGTVGRGVTTIHPEEAGPPPRVSLRVLSTDDGGALLRWHVYPYRGTGPAQPAESRYRLDDGPWSHWTTRREARFSTPDFDPHRVQVQARGRLGITSRTAVATFSVPQPLHEQKALVIPAVLALIAGVAGLGGALRRRRSYLLALAASEERGRVLLEGVSIGVLSVDETGRVLHANQQAAVLNGCDAADLLGADATALFEGDHAQQLLDTWTALTPGAPVVSREVLRLPRSGHQPVELRAIRLAIEERVLLHLCLRDISAELEAERQARVRMALARLRTHVVQMTDEVDWARLLQRFEIELHQIILFHNCCVNTVDGEGLVQYVEWGDKVERRVLEEIPAPVRACWQDQQPVYRRMRQEMTAESFDLQAVGIESVIDVPFAAGTLGVSHPEADGFDQGDIDILLQFAQILTEAHQRLTDLRELAMQEAAAQRARRHERILQLSESVAHEINNPLTQIIGFSELLLHNGCHDVEDGLRSIRDAGHHASDITRRLLSMAQRQGQAEQYVDLQNLVRETVILVRFGFAAHSVIVDLQAGPEALPVMAAPGDLEHVVFSLLQACHDQLVTTSGGTIVVRTRSHEADAIVRIGLADLSGGIGDGHVAIAPNAGVLSECRTVLSALRGQITTEEVAGAVAYTLHLPLGIRVRDRVPELMTSKPVSDSGVRA